MFNEVEQNQSLILVTKIIRPVLGSGLVTRPELFARLDASKRLPLILVSAPAGYGKSTLINSYLNIVDWPAAWISLDEHDNSLVTFMQYFLAAIQSIFPGACKTTEELLYSEKIHAEEKLAAMVVNDISRIDRDFFLVLDDYSYIHDLRIHNLLSKILRYPPNSMHLIITTRRDPPLPLINLRAQSRMSEIRVPELRFNLQESASLIRKICGPQIDDGTIAAIHEKTEGWITALCLTAIAYKGTDISQQRGFQPENEETIKEYLLNEFYSRLPVAIQDFLMRISILDRICGSLCEAVCRDGDSPVPLVSGLKYLDWAKSENLLLFSLDNENRWYQLHHLFRRFLQSKLQDHYSPKDIAMLHSRASVWLTENQQYDQALSHSLAAGDVNTGIQLVVRFTRSIRLPEKWPQLEKMITRFSQQDIENSPDLLVSEAWVMCARFLPGKATAVLEKAEKLISRTKMETSRLNYLQGQTAALHSNLSYWAGEYQNVLSQGKKALAILPEEWSYIRDLVSIQMTQALPLVQKTHFSTIFTDEWVKQILIIRTNSPIPLDQ